MPLCLLPGPTVTIVSPCEFQSYNLSPVPPLTLHLRVAPSVSSLAKRLTRLSRRKEGICHPGSMWIAIRAAEAPRIQEGPFEKEQQLSPRTVHAGWKYASVRSRLSRTDTYPLRAGRNPGLFLGPSRRPPPPPMWARDPPLEAAHVFTSTLLRSTP